MAAYEQTYIPGSKTSVFYAKFFFAHIIAKPLNKSRPPLYLKERFVHDQRVLSFSNTKFIDIFDRKLQQYIEGDLVNYNFRDFQEVSNPKRYEEYKESFAVLTLTELKAGFVVCLVPLAFTVCVFIIEWMLTLKNLIVFLFIFKKYFDMKKLEQQREFLLNKIFLQAAIRERA